MLEPAASQDLFGNEWIGGAILIVSPKYEGSNSYEVMGAPFVFPGSPFGGDGPINFTGLDGVQIRILKHGSLELGPVVGWRFGREDEDGDLLGGLGDVDGGFIVGAFGALRLGNFTFTTSYHHQVGGDDTGGLLRLRGEIDVPVHSTMRLTFGLGTNYATEEYMDAFFSVTPAQSATSLAGLPVYDAEAGFKDVFVSLTAAMQLDPRWALILGGSYAQLIGDAGDSPVIETEDQFTGTVILTYKLN
jgi:outer membrane scaffolding protein for murein synthesis (MipA/OmpV family)